MYERAGILATEKERFQLVRRISGIVAREFDSTTNVGALSNRITEAIKDYLSNSAHYYRDIKRKNNRLVNQLLPPAREYVEKGRGPKEQFERACRLASASNVSPMSAPGGAFRFEEVLGILQGKVRSPSFLGDVYKAVKGGSQALYLTDNAGEIGFDALLIRVLRELGVKVNLVVKEDPFFEDATREDALFFRIDELVEKIFTIRGFFIPRRNPSPLAAVFEKSDLLIVKGTGNYEAVKSELRGKNAIFMLKVKCGPIARETGVPPGAFVVKAEKGLPLEHFSHR